MSRSLWRDPQFCSVNKRALAHQSTATARIVLVVVALVATILLAAQPSIAGAAQPDPAADTTELDSPAGRADELVEAAGLNPEVVPQLVDVSTELETWILELEADVLRQREAVSDLSDELQPLTEQLTWVTSRAETLQTVASNSQLTREVVEARNELVTIEEALVEIRLVHREVEQRLLVAEADLALSLELVMVSWSLRQNVVQQFASVADMATYDLSSWPVELRRRVEVSLTAAQDVATAERDDAADDTPPVTVESLQGVPQAADAEPDMIWPAIGAVNSGFGMRIHPVWGGRRMHDGIDIDADYGADVVATRDGVVTKAGWNGGYGNMVEVDHGDGLTTRYAHLAEMHVAVGTTVVRGETVGLIGATGTATDAHLHFEVRADGAAVDPMLYIP